MDYIITVTDDPTDNVVSVEEQLQMVLDTLIEKRTRRDGRVRAAIQSVRRAIRLLENGRRVNQIDRRIQFAIFFIAISDLPVDVADPLIDQLQNVRGEL